MPKSADFRASPATAAEGISAVVRAGLHPAGKALRSDRAGAVRLPSLTEVKMLTNADLKRVRTRDRAYKLTDERGLHLFVAPSGLRAWRWRFRLGGKEQLLTIGGWPEISLDDARARRDVAREQLARGEDPRATGAAGDAPVRAFEYYARAWHAHMVPQWTGVHAADVLASLERDILPAIGAMPLPAITPPVVLSALRAIEQRGRRETARRVRQRVSKIFGYAMALGDTDTDPATMIRDLLTPPDPQRHHPALLEIADARQLLVDVEHLAAARVPVGASRFLALTAVRLAGVLGARWQEIEDLDGAEPLWRIPAARMKMAVVKKRDSANDHLVPLSPAAVEVLRQIANLHSGDANMHDLIFPGVGEGAIGALYDRAGYAGQHVPHGWRASFSTIMNERLPDDRVTIERVLAHTIAMSKVEAAYNRGTRLAMQLADRRRVLEAWADLIAA